jgi:apolipoprotein D and lipocalin family protein
MGDWNVIAYIPNFVEKNCISSIESYSLREDGKIDNGFVCKKSDGSETKLTSLAWVYDTQTQAEWRVRFNIDTILGKIPIPLHFNYLVIDLDSENYTYTVVGHPSRNLLWIMARDRTIEKGLYQKILRKIKKQGFDTSKIVKLRQKPR